MHVQLEESRVFTASSSLANVTVYSSTTAAVSTASIFDQAPVSAQAYVTGSSPRNTTANIDSRTLVMADSASGSVYRPSTVPPGSLGSHASLSAGQVSALFTVYLYCVSAYLLFVMPLPHRFAQETLRYVFTCADCLSHCPYCSHVNKISIKQSCSTTFSYPVVFQSHWN